MTKLNESRYSPGVLDGVHREVFDFLSANLGALLRYGAILTLVELVIWVVLPMSLWFIELIPSVLFVAMFAIAIHRALLMGDRRIPTLLDIRILIFIVAGVVQMLFAGAAIVVAAAGALLILLFVILFLPLSELPLPPYFPLATMLIVLVPSATLALSKTILYFPHIAITPQHKLSMPSVWELTRGVVLQISKHLFPYILLLALVGRFFSQINENADVASFMTRLVAAPAEGIYYLFYYLATAVMATLASVIYRRLTDDLRQRALDSESAVDR